jgi:hypothetical protein
MLELHVDANEVIHKEVAWRHEFGGTTVIRAKDELFRPLIHGQDKSAFHQVMLKSKNWVGGNGERALLPKSDSWDTGFGLESDAAMLCKNELVTERRKAHQ